MRKLAMLIKLVMGVALCLIPVTTDPISMKLRSETARKTWESISFYGDTFQMFYACLSSSESVKCSADLSHDSKAKSKTNEWRVVGVQKPDTDDNREVLTKYFSCHFPFPEKTLTCRRLQILEVRCEHKTITQNFRLRNDSATSSSCVSLMWDSLGESLIFDKKSHIVAVCSGIDGDDDGCTSTSKTTSTSIQPTQHTHPAPHHDHDDDEDDHDHHEGRPRHPIDDSLDTKSHIILTVVIGLSVVALLIIAAAFFRRKLLQKRALPKPDDEFANTASRRKKSCRTLAIRTVSIDVPAHSNSFILDPSSLTTNI